MSAGPERSWVDSTSRRLLPSACENKQVAVAERQLGQALRRVPALGEGHRTLQGPFQVVLRLIPSMWQPRSLGRGAGTRTCAPSESPVLTPADGLGHHSRHTVDTPLVFPVLLYGVCTRIAVYPYLGSVVHAHCTAAAEHLSISLPGRPGRGTSCAPVADGKVAVPRIE